MADQLRDVEAFLRQQRKEQVERVREMFARYGQQIYELILQAMRQRHGLPLMLQRLGVGAPRSQEQQLEAVAVFISENGPKHFLRLVRATPTRTVTAQAAPAPSAEAEPPRPLAPAFDARGQYIGPERRSGIERRAGGDRRNTSEAIRRNKRFGGDRRKVIRRQCDRAAAAALGLAPRHYPPQKS